MEAARIQITAQCTAQNGGVGGPQVAHAQRVTISSASSGVQVVIKEGSNPSLLRWTTEYTRNSLMFISTITA